MIISHKHKFIFLKTQKTAGTSVEIALSKFCGTDDVITPISAKDEQIRRKMGHPGPQGHLAPVSDYGPRDLLKLLAGFKRKLRYYNHISAKDVRERIGSDVWDSYYKFCIERNPWDRVISLYYYRNRREPRPTMAEFLRSGAPSVLKRLGIELYSIDGEVAVDRVCLFEELQDELEEVRQGLGLPEPLDLPRAKASYRKDRRHYRESYGKEERAMVEELFSQEIALHGFEF